MKDYTKQIADIGTARENAKTNRINRKVEQIELMMKSILDKADDMNLAIANANAMKSAKVREIDRFYREWGVEEIGFGKDCIRIESNKDTYRYENGYYYIVYKDNTLSLMWGRHDGFYTLEELKGEMKCEERAIYLHLISLFNNQLDKFLQSFEECILNL